MRLGRLTKSPWCGRASAARSRRMLRRATPASSVSSGAAETRAAAAPSVAMPDTHQREVMHSRVGQAADTFKQHHRCSEQKSRVGKATTAPPRNRRHDGRRGDKRRQLAQRRSRAASRRSRPRCRAMNRALGPGIVSGLSDAVGAGGLERSGTHQRRRGCDLSAS